MWNANMPTSASLITLFLATLILIFIFLFSLSAS